MEPEQSHPVTDTTTARRDPSASSSRAVDVADVVCQFGHIRALSRRRRESCVEGHCVQGVRSLFERLPDEEKPWPCPSPER